MVHQIEMIRLRWFGAMWSILCRVISGVSGTSHQMETSGQTQDLLERLYLIVGLGTSGYPPGEARKK